LIREFGEKVVRTYVENFSTFIQGHLVGATSLCRLALERRGATVIRPVRDAGG
jgi:hypothetical protein